MFEEQILDKNLHNRKAFSSGVKELDEYIQHFAAQQSKKGIAVVRVLIDISKQNTILGYYSLSAAQINVAKFDERTVQNLPHYPVPCFRMGRLATDLAWRNLGIGKLLIGCAVSQCLKAKKHVGAYALIVDAKSIQAQQFYQYYGFIACIDDPKTLYLPLGI